MKDFVIGLNSIIFAFFESKIISSTVVCDGKEKDIDFSFLSPDNHIHDSEGKAVGTPKQFEKTALQILHHKNFQNYIAGELLKKEVVSFDLTACLPKGSYVIDSMGAQRLVSKLQFQGQARRSYSIEVDLKSGTLGNAQIAYGNANAHLKGIKCIFSIINFDDKTQKTRIFKELENGNLN